MYVKGKTGGDSSKCGGLPATVEVFKQNIKLMIAPPS